MPPILRRSATTVLLALAVISAACSDGVTVPSTSEPAAAAVPTSGTSGTPPTVDELFAQIARATPGGFGGMFFDTASANLEIYLQQPGRGPEAVAALKRVFPDARILGAQTVIREARYDWLQLKTWRQQVDGLFAIPGVRMTDIDERLNRVRIGVADPGVQSRVEAELDRLGVPREAVVVEEVPPVRPALTLRERAPAVEGSFQIQNSNSGGLCSVGFNVAYNGYYGFMTAAHCTRNIAKLDFDPFYQSLVSSGIHAGTESADPEIFFYGGEQRGGWVCPPGAACRLSDAAVARFATSSFNFGYLARTTFHGTFPSDTGSVTVDPNKPRVPIVAETAYPLGGERLEKTGRTTGWTYGSVSQTCAHLGTTDSSGYSVLLMCQDVVSSRAQGGDSGSPVYALTVTGANLYGVLWGTRWPDKTEFVFSSMQNVRDEFGTILVR